jgi:transcriptional antiterminator RfaH
MDKIKPLDMKTLHTSDTPEWYAIYTHSRFEKKIYEAMRKSGAEVFLPMIKEKRVWSDRLKSVQVPLLPGYVFIRTPRQLLSQVYYYPGVVRVVSSEGKPCAIRDTEIGLLEKIVRFGFQAQVTTNCEVGDAVRVVRGPLKGWEGRVESKRGASRVVFLLDGIGQAVCVEVRAGEVERV